MAAVERVAGVIAASPSITGAGFAVRSDATSPVILRGVEPERFLAIIDIRKRLVAARDDLGGGDVVVGAKLAANLGVGLGDKLRISSSEGVTDVVTIRGLFSLGALAVDETWVLRLLRHARGPVRAARRGHHD